MQALDGTIANVALPNIQGSLSATQEQVAWVITSYIVSAAIATPLAGFCAVRFGVRRILVSSVIGFTIASMLCGAAQTLPQLVAFTLLSIAIGTFQLMLDRGEQIDWFGSKEIITEAAVAGVAAAMFVIHMLSSDHPFLPRDLFRDRNLMLGIIFTAITGLLMI